MAQFSKNVSGNPRGRPKTAHLETVDRHKKTQSMILSGTMQLELSWPELVDSMIKQAKKGNVTAATWLRDTFIGKPTESISHSTDIDSNDKLVLAYAVKSQA